MARIVPVLLVIPGIMLTSIPASDPVITESIESFFSFELKVGFSIFCGGMFGFSSRLVSSVGIPKSPARVGKRTDASSPKGLVRLISSEMMPKMPESKNTKSAKSVPVRYELGVFLCSGIWVFSVPSIRMVMASRT